MRVLIYAPVVGRGGAHRMLSRLIPLINADVSYLGFERDENGVSLQFLPHIQHIPLSPKPTYPIDARWSKGSLAQHHAQLQDMASDFDAIWLPTPWGSAGFDVSTPIVTTIHDYSWRLMGNHNAWREDELNWFRNHTQIVNPTRYQQAVGVVHYGIFDSTFIPHGDFVPDKFDVTPLSGQRVRDLYGLPDRYVLAFHCANHLKDPETILRAQYHARTDSDQVPPLVIAGIETEQLAHPRHPYHKQVKKLWQSLGYTLNKDLFILGQVPDQDIGGLYANASCVITATLSEAGISGTMYEAFTSRTPCIYTDLPQFREKLPDNTYGYPFKPKHWHEAGQQIVKACITHDSAMLERAYVVATGTAWEKVGARYTRLFEDVVQ